MSAVFAAKIGFQDRAERQNPR